ncbi:MAG: SH3 domain-containing protein [Candidatus Cloacimonadaceae bacterium]|jgi:hypothetical protein
MKQILKILTILGLVYIPNLLANEPTPEEYKEIVDSFKLKDTSEKELSRTYKINGEIIKAELQKEENEPFQFTQHIITFGDRDLGEPNYWTGINKYDQKPLFVSCIAPDKKIVFASLVRSSYYYKQKKQKLVNYAGFVAGVDKDTCCGNYGDVGDAKLFEGEVSSAYTSIPTYKPNEFYPYFNEQRILARLYETGTCDKEATKNANILVLVGDKWISQEESWNIKETIVETITQTILPKKQPLYKSPSIDSKTKMYLIKGDKVEILEEKDNWLHILYKGKKEIKAWIPKDAIKATE